MSLRSRPQPATRFQFYVSVVPADATIGPTTNAAAAIDLMALKTACYPLTEDAGSSLDPTTVALDVRTHLRANVEPSNGT
jgi:hypothetical protein